MAISATPKFGRFLNGSRSDDTIVGCRQDLHDDRRFYIMHANGNETPDGANGPIAQIINGGDRATIVEQSGNKFQVLFESGQKRGI